MDSRRGLIYQTPASLSSFPLVRWPPQKYPAGLGPVHRLRRFDSPGLRSLNKRVPGLKTRLDFVLVLNRLWNVSNSLVVL